MLQMQCPNCREFIKSPFLAEVSTIECHQCKENIPVKDVYITTKNFTMHRQDFLDRSFRFQNFLKEVEKERTLMANSGTASKKSLESIEQIYSSLQELLAGARNSYRMENTCDLQAEVNDNNKISQGRVLNLSTEGASIQLVTFDNIPRKKSELKVYFSSPELSEKLSTQAKVVWTREQKGGHDSDTAIIGVTFMDIDEHTHSSIWNYIQNNTPVSSQGPSR